MAYPIVTVNSTLYRKMVIARTREPSYDGFEIDAVLIKNLEMF